MGGRGGVGQAPLVGILGILLVQAPLVGILGILLVIWEAEVGWGKLH